MQLASSEDLDLLNQLVEKGIVERQAVIAVLAAEKQAFENTERKLRGRRLLIDPQAQRLSVSDPQNQTLLERQLLYSASKASDWQTWGSDLILTNDNGRQHQASWAVSPQAPYGLELTEFGCLSYAPGHQDWLGLGQTRLCNTVAMNPLQSGPYDLYVAPDASLFALGNRGAGELEIFSLESLESLHSLQLRPPGGRSAFNLSFDLKRKGIWFSDQLSSQLGFIHLKTGSIIQIKPGIGVLGNQILAPDGDHLYLLTLKPNQELVYFSLLDNTVKKQLSLKGDLLSVQRHDPSDLMALSPDQSQLLVMTCQHTPEPYTGILSLIDTQQVKTVKRYALKDGSKPAQLLFGQPSPLLAYQHKDLRSMLLNSGLISQEALMIMQGPTPEPLAEEIIPAPTFFEPPAYIQAQASGQNQGQASGPHQEAGSAPAAEPSAKTDTEQQKASAQITEAVAPIELGPEITDILSELLVERFIRQTGRDIRAQAYVLGELYKHAENVRQQLERQDPVELQVDKLFEGYSFKTLLRRREVLLRREQLAWLASRPSMVVPLECPSCHQKLMGHWECPVCGYELDNPLRLFKRQLASLEPSAHLPAGHILLPDPHSPRLLELNQRKQVVWQLDADQLSSEEPRDVLRLAHGNLLVVDSKSHALYEFGPRGKLHWSFNTQLSEKHRLNTPVRVRLHQSELAAGPYYWIVDQGHHRILQIDSAHQIHWEYGVQGEAGKEPGFLNTPSDLQLTPERTLLITDAGNKRVLELDFQGRIEQVFDAAYGLYEPVLAMRLWNGHTLIVDAAQFQILDLDPDGIVHDRINFYKSGMPAELRLLNPTGMIRLPNQDLILYNQRRAIHILPSQKKLIWLGAALFCRVKEI